MMIQDISIPLRPALAVWPGDAPFTFHLGWSMNNGDSVNVGQASLSVHTGTHIDAPFHFDASGQKAGELNLAAYLGPAVVVNAVGQWEIGREVFATVDLTRTPRVLVRTLAWTNHEQFPERVPTLAPDVPEWLGSQGVVLLGVDVPSVDAVDSKTLPLHRALHRANICILESVDLRNVEPGEYQLSALPLRLMDADGSPVRAILYR